MNIKEGFPKKGEGIIYSLTVGEIKELIKNLPDDGIIFLEKVEDFYFHENNWTLFKKKNDNSLYYTANAVETDGTNLLITGHF